MTPEFVTVHLLRDVLIEPGAREVVLDSSERGLHVLLYHVQCSPVYVYVYTDVTIATQFRRANQPN